MRRCGVNVRGGWMSYPCTRLIKRHAAVPGMNRMRETPLFPRGLRDKYSRTSRQFRRQGCHEGHENEGRNWAEEKGK